MDWQDAIESLSYQGNWNELLGYAFRKFAGRNISEGSVRFKRRRSRKFRTRYLVLRVEGRYWRITNAEIRYRKSKKVWGVFIDDLPIRHYRTLRSAKLALMPGVLDRMGAEGDRCLDPPCSVPSSKSEA